MSECICHLQNSYYSVDEFLNFLLNSVILNNINVLSITPMLHTIRIQSTFYHQTKAFKKKENLSLD